MARSWSFSSSPPPLSRSEEHTSELQSQSNLVCRLLLEKKHAINSHAHCAYTFVASASPHPHNLHVLDSSVHPPSALAALPRSRLFAVSLSSINAVSSAA